MTPARVRKLRSSRSSRGTELPRGPGDCRLAAAQASRSARSPWSCSTGGTVITIINNYRMQIAQEGALAKPWGNCSLDLGAEAWQGDRAYVRRDLRGETECRGWLPSALSSRSLRASPGLLPARRGAGAGGGESPQFSSLGSSPEEARGRRGLGRPGFGNADAPQMALASELHPCRLASWVNWARLCAKCLARSLG